MASMAQRAASRRSSAVSAVPGGCRAAASEIPGHRRMNQRTTVLAIDPSAWGSYLPCLLLRHWASNVMALFDFTLDFTGSRQATYHELALMSALHGDEDIIKRRHQNTCSSLELIALLIGPGCWSALTIESAGLLQQPGRLAQRPHYRAFCARYAAIPSAFRAPCTR